MPPKKDNDGQYIKNKIKGHLGHLSRSLDQWRKAIDLAEKLKQSAFTERMRSKRDTAEEALTMAASLTKAPVNV